MPSHIAGRLELVRKLAVLSQNFDGRDEQDAISGNTQASPGPWLTPGKATMFTHQRLKSAVIVLN